LLPFLLGIYKMLGRLAGNLLGSAGGPVGAAVGGALGTAIGGFTGGTIGGDVGKEVLGKTRMAGQIDPRLLMMNINMSNPNVQGLGLVDPNPQQNPYAMY